MSAHYIIEHARLGVYIGFDWGGTSGAWKPHFRWSTARDSAEIFNSLDRAIEERDKILAAIGVRAPVSIIRVTKDARGTKHYEEI